MLLADEEGPASRFATIRRRATLLHYSHRYPAPGCPLLGNDLPARRPAHAVHLIRAAPVSCRTGESLVWPDCDYIEFSHWAQHAICPDLPGSDLEK